jgi:hypothetical protein
MLKLKSCAFLVGIVFGFQAYSQKILVVFPDTSYIQFDDITKKIIKYNKKTEQETRTYIAGLFLTYANSYLGVDGPHSAFEYKNLGDSLNNYLEWKMFNTTQMSANPPANVVFPVKKRYDYLGRQLSNSTKEKLTKVVSQQNASYLLMINKFHFASPRPFDSKTYFHLHFEIFNQNLETIFGGVTDGGYRLNAKINYDSFLYMLRTQFQHYFNDMKQFVERYPLENMSK